MAAESYPFEDWENDFVFLSRYVYPSESGHIPPDYLREIEAYFQEWHPEHAAFRFRRASSMLSFLVRHIDSFTVGGLAMHTSESVQLSQSLWLALFIVFVAPDDAMFNPNPDPKDVLDLAEDMDSDEPDSA